MAGHQKNEMIVVGDEVVLKEGDDRKCQIELSIY